jgi:hypothetical protein
VDCTGQVMGAALAGILIGGMLMAMLEFVITKRVRCDDDEEGDDA